MTTLSARTGQKVGCVGHDCDDCKKQKREHRTIKQNLRALTDHVLRHLVWLDEEMAKHESPERGKRLAAMANVLDMANDAARYHALGIDFRKDDKGKERARVMRANVQAEGAAHDLSRSSLRAPGSAACHQHRLLTRKRT